MIEVKLSSYEIIVGQISIINLSLRNIGDFACWDVWLELNLPPDGINILEGRKAIAAEYFPSNSTLEHQIRVLAKKPGIYELTSRRFHYCDAQGILKRLDWQITLTASGSEYAEDNPNTSEADMELMGDFVARQELEKQRDGQHFANLFENIMQAFNMDELRLICLEMSIDFEVLSGENKNRKILDLVEYCQRRGTLNELLAICQQQRPYLDW